MKTIIITIVEGKTHLNELKIPIVQRNYLLKKLASDCEKWIPSNDQIPILFEKTRCLAAITKNVGVG